MVAEYKHRIGFPGLLLLEPKPQEPTKHQYDYDCATVHGFLDRYDLLGEYHVNIEVQPRDARRVTRSITRSPSRSSTASSAASTPNRGDPQNGWDTDQFPNSVEELTLALHEILLAGGFTSGGFNFDTKLRRQSLDRDDLFHGHIGGIDTLARSLLVATQLIEDGALQRARESRYARMGRANVAVESSRARSTWPPWPTKPWPPASTRGRCRADRSAWRTR